MVTKLVYVVPKNKTVRLKLPWDPFGENQPSIPPYVLRVRVQNQWIMFLVMRREGRFKNCSLLRSFTAPQIMDVIEANVTRRLRLTAPKGAEIPQARVGLGRFPAASLSGEGHLMGKFQVKLRRPGEEFATVAQVTTTVRPLVIRHITVVSWDSACDEVHSWNLGHRFLSW